MEKPSSPIFPSTLNILEDFSDANFMPQKYSKDLSLEDEALQTAYSCFLNIRQLDKDIKQHSNFNSKLEELNQKLVENISSLKAQAKKKWSCKYYGQICDQVFYNYLYDIIKN